MNTSQPQVLPSYLPNDISNFYTDSTASIQIMHCVLQFKEYEYLIAKSFIMQESLNENGTIITGHNY